MIPEVASYLIEDAGVLSTHYVESQLIRFRQELLTEPQNGPLSPVTADQQDTVRVAARRAELLKRFSGRQGNLVKLQLFRERVG